MTSPEPSSWSKMSPKHFWIFIFPAMILPGIASLFYFVWFQGSLLAQITYFGTKIFTVIWPVITVYLILPKDYRLVKSLKILADKSFSLIRGITITIVSWGAFLGFVIFLLMILLQGTPVMSVIELGTPAIAAKSVQLGFYQHFWVFAFFICVVHSFIEEYYWRFFVYGWARKLMKPSIAAILASLAFGFHHFVITIQYFDWFWGFIFGFAVVGAGLVWCWMYEKQKTFVGAWISHMFADLAIMWVGYGLLFKPGVIG